MSKYRPGALWCFGTSEGEYHEFDFQTREDAIIAALEEDDEASTIYIAQHETNDELELPLETDVGELLYRFCENQSLDERWEERMQEEKASLEKLLAPCYERFHRAFRGWMHDNDLAPADFYNEEELSRADAQAIRLASIRKEGVATEALKDASKDLKWVESFLGTNGVRNSNLQDDATHAVERLRKALDLALEQLDLQGKRNREVTEQAKAEEPKEVKCCEAHDDKKLCAIEGCGKPVQGFDEDGWVIPPYCQNHTHKYRGAWLWCEGRACCRRFVSKTDTYDKGQAICCSLHGGVDYILRTKED